MAKKIPWYAKLFFGRYRKAVKIAQEVTESIHDAIQNLGLKTKDLPPQLRPEPLVESIFRSLASSTAEHAKENHLRSALQQLHSIREERLNWARQVVGELRKMINQELEARYMSPSVLSPELTENGPMVERVFHSYSNNSTDSVKRAIWKDVLGNLRFARLGRILEHILQLFEEEVLYQAIRSAVKKACDDDNLPVLADEGKYLPPEIVRHEINIALARLSSVPFTLKDLLYLLTLCSDDELAALENNLGLGRCLPVAPPDASRAAVPQVFTRAYLRMLLMMRASELAADLDRAANRDFGREATSKGSIGHDSLNVKTVNRSAWTQQCQEVFRNIQRIREHEPQRSLPKSEEV